MARAEMRGLLSLLALALASTMSLSLMLATARNVTAMPAQIQARWPHLPAALQHELQARETLWLGLTPDQQHDLRQRLVQWDALPRAIRRDRRERWQAWRALPADQRLQVQAAALAYAALPPQQQQALRMEFLHRDAAERHGWLLGPALGADFPALQPLVLQVPALQRAPLLIALRAMTPAERVDLAMLAQRTAPQQRDALRRALLSTSTANRPAWLQAQLAQ